MSSKEKIYIVGPW